MPPPSSLRYWLVVPDGDAEYTPFQGFGLEITSAGYPELIALLSVLPASPLEIFVEPELLPSLRRHPTLKSSAIVGLSVLRRHLEKYLRIDVINIVLGLHDEIANVSELDPVPPLILGTLTRFKGAHALGDFKGHPSQLLDAAIRDELLARAPAEARKTISAAPLRQAFPPGVEPSRVAGVTIPNEVLSESLGHSYAGANPINPGEGTQHVDAILDSLARARTLIGKESAGLILYAPAIMRQFQAIGSGYWNNLLRRIQNPDVREMIKDGLLRNPNYSGFTLRRAPVGEPTNPYDDPVAAFILTTRQTELRLTAHGIGALSASTTQPAIRLPNSVNFRGADLRAIEQHAVRDNPRGYRLLQESYRRLADGMMRGIDPRIIEELRAHTGAVTLVADAPLEWLPIDGVPLMIGHEISRIGMTPGNQMLAQCAYSDSLSVTAATLHDVLVVRSFADRDPVRTVLERALGQFELAQVRARFVDVDSSEALIAALNRFKGALVVFDCHGGHGGEEAHGWLHIGRERVDVWQLAHKARIPPIVVLSACSTFALAGSHASVANGLLRSGAITVVGTFLPVNALRSATFVARLLYRIDAFLPAIKDLGENYITWRTLVGTFLRMSYATDLLRFFLNRKAWLDEDMLRRIGVAANNDINSLRSNWHERLVRRISAGSRRSISEVMEAIQTEAALVETMYYCQTGRPETIGIHLE